MCDKKACATQELFRQFYRLMPLAAKPMLGFAVPGKERQDSVFNGFEVAPVVTRPCHIAPIRALFWAPRPLFLALARWGLMERPSEQRRMQ